MVSITWLFLSLIIEYTEKYLLYYIKMEHEIIAWKKGKKKARKSVSPRISIMHKEKTRTSMLLLHSFCIFLLFFCWFNTWLSIHWRQNRIHMEKKTIKGMLKKQHFCKRILNNDILAGSGEIPWVFLIWSSIRSY